MEDESIHRHDIPDEFWSKLEREEKAAGEGELKTTVDL